MDARIEFVNHASVLISGPQTAVLSDPWYSGDAFHRGWTLLVETPDDAVERLLARTTHLWLSHEHPDHFSIAFFRRFAATLRDRGIPVLFQTTADGRVAAYLRGQGLELRELAFGRPERLGPDVTVTCLKDEFYDSALSLRVGDSHVLNLNDCNIRSPGRAAEIRQAVGPCDVLLTQFSYAAWKGGRDNRAWREAAAAEKIAAMRIQAETLTPAAIIPFASFVRFANRRNAYLNDAANTPETVVEALDRPDRPVVVMQPGDIFDGRIDHDRIAAARAFWRDQYATLPDRPLLDHTPVPRDELDAAFAGWVARIRRNNSARFIALVRHLSPVAAFRPVTVDLDDIGARLTIDLVAGTLTPATGAADISLSSGSLAFVFGNPFGFDTLTVNGCFEEVAPGGFSRAARLLAIENLNNLGIAFRPGILFRGRVIAMFMERLLAISRRLARRG